MAIKHIARSTRMLSRIANCSDFTIWAILAITTSPEGDMKGDPDYHEFQKEQKKWSRASCFCNVHKDSFEVWWKKFTQLPNEEPTIEELSTHIDRMIKKAYLPTVEKSINQRMRTIFQRTRTPCPTRTSNQWTRVSFIGIS